jgi:hypothetical protein
MRNVPPEMTAAWQSEDKTGPRKPVVRATIAQVKMVRFPYDTRYAPGGDMDWEAIKNRVGYFTTLLFGTDVEVREIRNIRSYSWSRTVDGDIAECTITIRNTELTPIGNQERTEHAEDFDMPGFFSPNRGDAESEARWGYVESGWEDFYIPDRVVKTYEGYGCDGEVAPGLDPNLMQSGTWLIDRVTSNATGDIVLHCRDLGRLLLDQVVFPPVIPYEEYPLEWNRIRTAMIPGRSPTGGSWSGKLADKGTARSSNEYYDVELDPTTGLNYVEANGSVHGHHPKDAVTKVTSGNAVDPDDPEPYWLSTGQETRWSRVWWEFEFNNPRDVAALRMSCVGGPYRIFVSLQNSDGDWVGAKKIPYEVTTKDVDIEAGKKQIKNGVADRAKKFDVVLPKVYADIKKVRVTFSRLWDSRTSIDYPWRAGLKNIEVYWGTKANMGFAKGDVAKVVGNYKDYTDIVKWVCAWGGFYWPGHGADDVSGDDRQDYIRLGWTGDPGEAINLKRWVKWAHADNRLAKGRVWGDFMNTGTADISNGLKSDLFDKQPLLDVISYVRDITGFLFFIDEQGAAIWRMPNVWKHGNYLSPSTLGGPTRARSSAFVTIDETQTLLDWSVETSSESNREVIFISDVNGRYGVAINGYAPANAALRRTAGWTDTHFESKNECRTMADLIAARQMHDYRRGTLRIPGYPAIQMDDQIRIYERVTSETYFHYVLGIECDLDMEAGEWFYNLTTHWLGEDPTSLVVETTRLNGVTQNYLELLGMDDTDNGVESSTEDQT